MKKEFYPLSFVTHTVQTWINNPQNKPSYYYCQVLFEKNDLLLGLFGY